MLVIRGLHRWGLLVAGLLLALALAGCGGGAKPVQAFTSPAPPSSGAYAIVTQDYYTLYTPSTMPFDPSAQFTSADYPVTVSYQTLSPGPSGFDLATQSENAIKLWAKADARMCIVSNAPVSTERIRTELVESISWEGLNNILGLTKQMYDASGARFEVLIATVDPIDHTPLTALEMQKCLTHEMGHAFGLGHAPDKRDLMYYQSNVQQGAIPATFVTFGDAMALWQTLNARRVDWVHNRLTVTPYQAFTRAAPTVTTTNRAATVDESDGTVVCVYTKE
jgi:hypothetical protein